MENKNPNESFQSAQTEEGKQFNDTLNLPKTDFPMRGGLPQKEPKS